MGKRSPIPRQFAIFTAAAIVLTALPVQGATIAEAALRNRTRNLAPTAVFTSSVSDLALTVDASGSADSDGTIRRYSWKWGDGTTGTGETASRRYATAGSYKVSLTVTDDRRATTTTTETVTVTVTKTVTVPAPAPNVAPTAAFTSSVSDLALTVDASGSADSDGTIAAYKWTWGDTTTSTGRTATHTYPTAGSYQVALTVTDNNGATTTVTKTVTVTVPAPAPNVAPTAAFTSSVSDLALTVDASGSADSDGTIAAYKWTWGDTTTSTGRTATHTYPTAGTYQVALTVTDNNGATTTVTKTVTVPAPAPNVAPTAAFTSSVSDLALTVDASGSADSDGTIAAYKWTWGDTTTSTGRTATHTYPTAGSYQVALTVTDNNGATTTVTKTVTVTVPAPAPNVAPTAAFTSSVSDLALTVDASGSADSDGTIAAYKWTWGDTTTSTGRTATHTYPTAGTYQVALTVTDNNGATTTVTKTVTVTAPTIGATFNVRDFGAVGNGTVDDTAAFRAAITAGAGKTVLIPDGTFRISAPVTVPAGTTMTGTGTIHQTSAGRSGLVLSGSGVTVEGVTLLGSRTSNVYAGGEDAIRGAGASTGSPLTNIMIRSVTISGWGAHGVYLQYVKGFTVSGSNVHDVGYAGIGVMSGFDGSISGNRVDNITPGTATNMYGIFLSYSGDGGVTDPPSARVVVDGNTVSRVAWQGINSHAGSNLTITNNHVNACTSGVFIAGTGTTGLIISGNVIDNLADTAPDATGKAILVMGSLAAPASGEINNNIIRRSKWVLLQNTQGLVVSGNTFDRSNPSGILLNGHNTSFAITGNTFTDMWSAAENTAGIDTSSTGYDTGTISGNVLRRGSKTASYINNWGFRLFGAGTGSNVQATNNDFTAATKAPIG